MHMDLRGEGKIGESSTEGILKASGIDGISWGRINREKTPGLSPWAFQHLEVQQVGVGGGEGLGSWMWCPRSQEETMFQGESEQFCSVSMGGQVR